MQISEIDRCRALVVSTSGFESFRFIRMTTRTVNGRDRSSCFFSRQHSSYIRIWNARPFHIATRRRESSLWWLSCKGFRDLEQLHVGKTHPVGSNAWALEVWDSEKGGAPTIILYQVRKASRSNPFQWRPQTRFGQRKAAGRHWSSQVKMWQCQDPARQATASSVRVGPGQIWIGLGLRFLRGAHLLFSPTFHTVHTTRVPSRKTSFHCVHTFDHNPAFCMFILSDPTSYFRTSLLFYSDTRPYFIVPEEHLFVYLLSCSVLSFYSF